MKTVLFFMSGYSWAEKRSRDSILQFAQRARWRVQCVPYAEALKSRYLLLGSSPTSNIKNLIDFWKPEGCIVECGAAPDVLQPDDFGDVPVVFLDRDPETVSGNAVCVCSDGESVAAAALDELWQTGIRTFAYVGWHTSLSWSRQRQDSFSRQLAERNLTMKALKVRCPLGRTQEAWTALLKDIKSLPRPIAIFAANDIIAEQVVSVCCQGGLSVPNDVAVVGVDNAEDICENAQVPISSIPLDSEGAGTVACECLMDLMRHPRKMDRIVHFGVKAVVRRASTRTKIRDIRVVRALEFIRRAATAGAKVADVVKEMGCSRRLADQIFKSATGRTVQAELLFVKFEKAKELLRQGNMSMNAVAHHCGFGTINDFDRAFKRHTGDSPRAWLKQHAFHIC